MLKESLKYVGRGEDSQLLVFTPPLESIAAGIQPSCLCIPVLPRDEGLLIAIPEDFLHVDVVTDALMSDDQGLFGPSRDFSGPLVEEDETGQAVVNIGIEARFLVIDISDACIEYLREYDPVTDPSADHRPFHRDRPEAIIQLELVMARIRDWLQQAGGLARMDFYSAREEPNGQDTPEVPKTKAATKKAATKKVTTASLAETVNSLSQQVQMLMAQQKQLLEAQQTVSATPAVVPVHGGSPLPAALPPVSSMMPAPPVPAVSKFARALGPPPKTKAPGSLFAVDVGEDVVAPEDPGLQHSTEVTRALMQQSQAITALVSHLATGDPLSELANTSGSSQGVGTKGVARRERLQQDLAAGTSGADSSFRCNSRFSRR